MTTTLMFLEVVLDFRMEENVGHDEKCGEYFRDVALEPPQEQVTEMATIELDLAYKFLHCCA
jgi:hypothetical protein